MEAGSLQRETCVEEVENEQNVG